MNTPLAALAILAIVLTAFALATVQSFLNVRIGTDHAVHAFLVRAIRRNRYRLFVRIPGLLNESFCAALPLYLHAIMARLRPTALHLAERLLNPTLNALHVGLFAVLAWIAATQTGLRAEFIVLATALFAFTPQFHHALSARNFGLSARGIGLFLLTAFMLSAALTDIFPGMGPWIALIVIAYLIWAFNTFGAQALTIISLLLALLFWRLAPLAGAVGGLMIFIVLHPRYSLGYLRHTLRFIRSYAVELAPVYLLSRRYSIWRDLVWDIWIRLRRNPRDGLRYAYENSVLIAMLLNPLLPFTLVAVALGVLPRDGLVGFAADVAMCGAAAFLVTSFRPTRFLGEPERYIEAVTPWATLAASAVLFAELSTMTVALLALVVLLASLVQLAASHMLLRHLDRKSIQLGPVEAAAAGMNRPVRCSSNNEQLTKLLLSNDWQFAYCIAVGTPYAGMTAKEVFSPFPFQSRDACARIVTTYRVNLCVLDRTLYDDVFDTPPPGLLASRCLYESEGLRALAFDWAPAET